MMSINKKIHNCGWTNAAFAKFAPMPITAHIRARIHPYAVALIVLFIMITTTYAQNMLQPYKLVNGPTAGVLSKGTYDLEFQFYPAGDLSYGAGMNTGMHVGITDRFSLGLSYGGEGLIGRSDRVDWNRYPGIFVKYRLLEERFATPAIAIGFDNQGHGGIAYESLYGYNGYIYKSPGFYAAISKNFIMLKAIQIGFHVAVNYSLEGADDISWPNVIGGIDIGINEELAIAFEYDFAANDLTGSDDKGKHFRPFHGIMNLGLRWAFAPNFHVDLGFKDILENKMRRWPTFADPDNKEPVGWAREIKIVYIASF